MAIIGSARLACILQDAGEDSEEPWCTAVTRARQFQHAQLVGPSVKPENVLVVRKPWVRGLRGTVHGLRPDPGSVRQSAPWSETWEHRVVIRPSTKIECYYCR